MGKTLLRISLLLGLTVVVLANVSNKDGEIQKQHSEVKDSINAIEHGPKYATKDDGESFHHTKKQQKKKWRKMKKQQRQNKHNNLLGHKNEQHWEAHEDGSDDARLQDISYEPQKVNWKDDGLRDFQGLEVEKAEAQGKSGGGKKNNKKIYRKKWNGKKNIKKYEAKFENWQEKKKEKKAMKKAIRKALRKGVQPNKVFEMYGNEKHFPKKFYKKMTAKYDHEKKQNREVEGSPVQLP